LYENALPATSARTNPGEPAMAETDNAGDAFCRADVGVGGPEMPTRGSGQAQQRLIAKSATRKRFVS
jgi:hypothetical protein